MRTFYFLIFFIIGANCDFFENLQNSTSQKKAQNLADECLDLLTLEKNVSKSYLLQKFNRTAPCDMESDGGGWLVIQRRKKVTNQVDFKRDWVSYKEGFGNLDTEFWIGNEFLHRITNQKSFELRINMKEYYYGSYFAAYSNFKVGNEESGYKLRIGGYEGNVADRLSFYNNQKFSTFDRDNNCNCAKKFSGGFWFDGCNNFGNLNGVLPTFPLKTKSQFIRWLHYDEDLSLTDVKMMIRPKKEQKVVD